MPLRWETQRVSSCPLFPTCFPLFSISPPLASLVLSLCIFCKAALSELYYNVDGAELMLWVTHRWHSKNGKQIVHVCVCVKERACVYRSVIGVMPYRSVWVRMNNLYMQRTFSFFSSLFLLLSHTLSSSVCSHNNEGKSLQYGGTCHWVTYSQHRAKV